MTAEASLARHSRSQRKRIHFPGTKLLYQQQVEVDYNDEHQNTRYDMPSTELHHYDTFHRARVWLESLCIKSLLSTCPPSFSPSDPKPQVSILDFQPSHHYRDFFNQTSRLRQSLLSLFTIKNLHLGLGFAVECKPSRPIYSDICIRNRAIHSP